jgi:hypothetical protein
MLAMAGNLLAHLEGICMAMGVVKHFSILNIQHPVLPNGFFTFKPCSFQELLGACQKREIQHCVSSSEERVRI